MQRTLGIFEDTQAFANTHFPFNVVAVLRLAGAPDPEIPQRAFALLRERHPLLAVRIHEGQGRRIFDTDDVPPMPYRIVPSKSEHDWMALAEDELDLAFDLATGPLIRVTYLDRGNEERQADIVMTLHHVILDADSGTQLVRELLTLCATLAADRLESLPQLPLPPAAETLFPAAFQNWRGFGMRAGFVLRQMADEARFQWHSRGKRQPPVHSEGHPRILPMQLPEQTSATLIQRCRRQRVTLNGALCAALLLVVQRRLYGGEDRLLRNFLFANLRPYLDSALPADNLGSCFAMMRFTTRVRPHAAFWDLARDINRQVYTAAKRGEKYLNLLMSRAVMKMMMGQNRFRMSHTALSYTGVANLPDTYGSIRLTGLHSFVTNFVLGPEYSAQVRLFAGRLWWDIVYLDCDMDERTARVLAQEIFAELEAQTNAARP